MDMTNTSQQSLSISEKTGANQDYIPYEDGTYEAKYTGFKLFEDKSQWGTKKAARLYFEFTRGKYKAKKITCKGTFVLDKETGNWFIGSKTKLADYIKAVTGGGELNEKAVGRKVFLTVVNVPIKNGPKKGEMFSGVTSIIPFPTDGDDVADVTAADVAAVAAPSAPSAPLSQVPRNVELARKLEAAGLTKPAAETPKNENLMDDLTEFSDFK